MGSITAIQRRIEYGRFYAEAELTENGAYIKGQVPTGFSGSFIAQIHVCYAIVSVDATGRLLLTTYNPEDLLDVDGNSGAEIQAPNDTGTFIVRPNTNAAASESVLLVWSTNSNIPTSLKTLADTMWEVAKRELGDWYV